MEAEQHVEFSPVVPGEILALRLGLYFGTTPEFWMNLQAHYDLKLARRTLLPETAERIAAQRVA